MNIKVIFYRKSRKNVYHPSPNVGQKSNILIQNFYFQHNYIHAVLAFYIVSSFEATTILMIFVFLVLGKGENAKSTGKVRVFCG